MRDFLLDAQAALGFVTSQTSHIEREVNETVYPDIQYQALIPVDTSASPWIQTVTYYSSDKFGTADWINGNADGIPLAGSERSKHETAVHMAGIGYGYGLEELSQAQMLGVPLQAEDAGAARRAYEEMVDRIALKGDATKGFEGILNHSKVVAESAKTGDWENPSTTEDQILADVNGLLTGVSNETLQTSLADTLLLSPGRLNYIATTRLGDTTMTILEFLKKNNIYTVITGKPLTIRAARGLETAGTGNSQRMIAYRRSPQVLKLHIPMPHRFLRPWQKSALYIEVPGIFRLGGVDVRRPKEMRYADGI